VALVFVGDERRRGDRECRSRCPAADSEAAETVLPSPAVALLQFIDTPRTPIIRSESFIDVDAI
jgi:hypothetical protein